MVVIWLPMVLRLLLLVVPFRRAISQLAPHSGWAFKQMRELPVKGFGILAMNEILAFSIPPLLVYLVRMTSDPLGWQKWSEVSDTGLAMLTLFLFVWIFFDLLRISRVRRMMKAVEKRDIAKLRKVADAGLGIRRWLTKFSGKEKKTDEENQKRLAEVQGMQQSIAGYQKQAQEDLQKKEADLMKPIYDEARAAIQAVAKAQGFDYVLDAMNGQGVLFANGKDLLADVKKQLGF